MLRVTNSALKHGCTREDISHAYDLALYEGVIDEDADPLKLLIIGPDGAANLLELVGGELDNGDVLIWHATKCRTKYLSLLPETGGE
jgi:hypothetical protein